MTVEWRHLRPGELDHELLWTAVLIGMAAAVVAWHLTAPLLLPPVLCPLKTATGVPCVTCGGTRAALSLMHGRPFAALRWNPLVALALAAVVPYVLYAASVTLLRRPRLRLRFSDPDRARLRAAVLLLLAANWIFLIVDGR